VGFEEEHQADDVGVHGGAEAAGVGHDEVRLELAEVAGGDVDFAEGAEAGGDPVEGARGGFDAAVEVVFAFQDEVLAFCREGEGGAVAEDAADGL
jgi:hypothetical protein